jgi:hypothetical protein
MTTPDSPSPAARHSRLLYWTFVFAVLAFAWLRFSDNVADNDLWGHVLYGQRNWTLGQIERVDKLSWTAAGAPWINHEAAAEVVLGFVHQAAGGMGLWFFMIGMAAITIGWAYREGGGVDARQRSTALALLAVSVNFIALGYAARPQLFTLLAIVALLVALRRFFSGKLAWGFVIPLIFACWVNLHGGFLAGWVVLLVACILELTARLARPKSGATTSSTKPGVLAMIVLGITSTLALALNPWGFHLVVWTVETLRLPRPYITEWQPLLPDLASAPFYFVLVCSALAWVFSRQSRRPWEAVVLILFGAMAILHRRHAPLFGLANLILSPTHLADAGRRLAPRCASLLTAFRRAPMQLLSSAALLGTGAVCLRTAVSAPREHPFTIEVPRNTYPVAAIEFMRHHGLTGNTLTFFDWGQEVLWELPFNPVSFDGRLDTVYSNEIMEAHWRLYAGSPPGPALDLDKADVALLPNASAGVNYLLRNGWRTVYHDLLAAVLVHDLARRPALAPLGRPAAGDSRVVQGRAPFPDYPPLLGTSAAPH